VEELKLMRGDLTNQIKKLSDDVKPFQRNTNERLQKIESVISKVEEIDGLKFKQQELEARFDSLETSLNSMNANTEEIDNLQQTNDDLRKKLEHLERYSRDFNIRVLGVSEEDGEDCIAIILDYIARLGFEHAVAEVENAHRTGLAVFLDFEKAFDSIEWDFIRKCLESFDFGPNLRQWTSVFYKDISSCVNNNGVASKHFYLERGVRQGCPLVIAMELLAQSKV